MESIGGGEWGQGCWYSATTAQPLQPAEPVQNQCSQRSAINRTSTANQFSQPVQPTSTVKCCHYSGLTTTGGPVVVCLDSSGSGRLYWYKTTVVVRLDDCSGKPYHYSRDCTGIYHYSGFTTRGGDSGDVM